MPAATNFLLNFNQNEFNIQVRASEYYSFFIIDAARARARVPGPGGRSSPSPGSGSSTPEQLAHNRRYAYLILAVVAMLLPGTDPVTMLIEMAPLLVLFEFSLILARLVGTRLGRAARREQPGDEAEPPASPAS